MDNKEINRDKLLDEILRETAGHKVSEPIAPEVPSASDEHIAPSPYFEEPTDAAQEVPAEEHAYEPEPIHTAARSISVDTGSFTGNTWNTEQLEKSQSFSTNNRLVDDLEGDSQPFFPENAAMGTASTAVMRPRKKHKQHRVMSALVMTIVIIGVSVLLSSLLIVYGRDLLGINSDSSTKIVTIQPGATMNEIAETLQKSGIITKPEFFVLIAGMSDKDGDIRPGDHELRPDMAYETILSELVSDPLDSALSVSITFPEGIRLCDAADLLEENNVCEADEFLDYFNHDASFGLAYEEYLPSFQDDKFYHMEGYCFPDTYTFYQEMDVELVCEKIMENFNSKIPSEYYDRMKALNLTLDETITLASMIQAEAGNTEQMATISSVFWNRLNNATEYPLLQSDPTTKYVEEVIKPHSESYNEALYISYDTYQCTGLPAGPIDNPGSDAIYAALYPENTNYYYFYSNIDTKETYFSETLEGHDANQQKVAEDQAAAETGVADDSTAE